MLTSVPPQATKPTGSTRSTSAPRRAGRESRRSATAALSLLPLALLLSGFASLTYQIVWVRRFAVVLGTTNAALTLVLAMFLGGLGLGALLAGRSGGKLGAARLGRRFLLLEIGAAGFAAALPLYLGGTLPLAAPCGGGAGSVPAHRRHRLGVSTARRHPDGSNPADADGAAPADPGPRRGKRGRLALCRQHRGRPHRQRGRRPAPHSRTGTHRVHAVRGRGERRRRGPGLHPVRAVTRLPGPSDAVRAPWFGTRALFPFGGIAALSGFAAMAAEIGWARLAALLFGPTIYTFACVIAAVILGVALGSAAAARLPGRPGAGRAASPRFWLAAVQLLGAASSAAVAWFGSGLVLPVGELIAENAGDVPHLLNVQFLGTAAVLLLPGLAFGATFPLAVAGAAASANDSAQEAGRATGTIYATNAGGNVVGALAAGFLLIPWLGIEAALVAAVLAQLVAALLASPRVLTLALAGALGVFGFTATGSWDWEALTGGLYRVAPQMETSRHRDFLRKGRLQFLDQGASATVTVKEVAGELSLAIDGKVDATDGADMLTQRLLAHLPLLLHPAPESVFIVGHGSGVTAGSALRHPVARVAAAEISPEVAMASRLFEESNGAPWEDGRFALLEVDARNQLLLDRDSYDVVISEPSNPWMSGVSPLFTVEFFELVRSRLTDGGLFCQWIHLYNLAEEDLRTVVGGFTDVFPETALFVLHDGDALLIGSKGAFPAAPQAAIEERIVRLADELAPYGITGFGALRAWLTATSPALDDWAREAPRHRDDHPILEFRAPLSVHAATAFRNRTALEELAGDPALGPFGQAAAPGARTLAGRAGALLSAQNPDWALDLAREALRLDPAEPDAADAVVRASLASGRAEEGGVALRTALAAVPDDGAAEAGLTVALARLLLRAGQPDDAAAVLEGGPAALAEDREALLLAAEVQVERGDPDSAEALVLTVLQADPRDAEAAAWLAELSVRRGRAEEAAERAAAILAERPGTERALLVRAVALAELGRTAAAREAFGALVRESPEPAFHWANFAAFEAAAGRAPEAVRLYREAVDRDPSNLTAYRGLLEAATRAGDAEQVRRAREVLGSSRE